MKDVAVCLLAFKSCIIHGETIIEADDFYLEAAHRLIKRINKHKSAPVCLLTNRPEYFSNTDIYIFGLGQEWSYTDKITACRYALKSVKINTAIYVDADCRFFIDMIPELKWKPGIHTAGGWFKENNTIESVLEVPYFNRVINYCKENGLKWEGAPLINERMFAISGEVDPEFYKVYYELSLIVKENDVDFGNYPTGRGEGLIIGLAIINSNIEWHDKSDSIMKLYSTLKHNHRNKS